MLHLLRSCEKRALLLVGVILLELLMPFHTYAAPIALTELSDQMTRMKVSEASDHTLIIRTVTGAGTGTVIKFIFPNGFNLTTISYDDMQLFHGATTPPSTELTIGAAAGAGQWGVNIASQTITLTHPTDATGDVEANDYVMLKIGTNAGGTNQIVNSSSATNNIIYVQVGPNGDPTDTGKIAIATLTNDQVVAVGFVDAAITCVLDSNTTFLGFMTPAAVASGDVNTVITIGTNANNGYALYVSDAGNNTNPGLYNTEADYLVGSTTSADAGSPFDPGPTLLAPGTEGWGIWAGGSTNAIIDAPYANSGNTVGGLKLTQEKLAHNDSQMEDTDVITVRYRAAVALYTPAGRYEDTITYVATAKF